ncbi:MAG: thioesterase family protein [Betaproteobacteria bacterium]
MHRQRNLVRVEHMPIRWGDMDAMQHVNNTVYFRYMEQIRVSWYESMFGALSGAHEEGIVIVNASCTFLKPLMYPGTVEVKMLFGAARRSSFESFYELWMNDVMYADGAARIVWIDVREGKARPLPASIAALCPAGA